MLPECKTWCLNWTVWCAYILATCIRTGRAILACSITGTSNRSPHITWPPFTSLSRVGIRLFASSINWFFVVVIGIYIVVEALAIFIEEVGPRVADRTFLSGWAWTSFTKSMTGFAYESTFYFACRYCRILCATFAIIGCVFVGFTHLDRSFVLSVIWGSCAISARGYACSFQSPESDISVCSEGI